ncbi:hypothetical protein V6N13_149017 [Hibiscus sabdariffa]
MNVVGKVGSLISQEVYSVATPFHPFGGAVDIIVVQQPDGTFWSTPWYVRFGKFQGVLKGAKKVVGIAVNGVEVDFHMCLDNSGQAYFLREVDSGEGNETSGDFKDSNGGMVSDSEVAQLRDECDGTSQNRLERVESDTMFYDFQDDQLPQEDLVNLSEYDSGQYEGLDNVCFGEAQGLGSEVVLFSVDGHIITAHVSASDESVENVQTSKPQFHIGPGEGTPFGEGNGEFNSGDNVLDADYICKLNSVAPKDSSVRQCDVEDASVHVNKDVFRSYHELSEHGRHGKNTNSEEIDSPLQAQSSQDKPPRSPPESCETETGAISDSRNGFPDLPIERKTSETDFMGSNNASVNMVVNDSELRDERFGTSAVTEGMNVSLQSHALEDKSSEIENVEIETTCTKEITAEVFEAHRILEDEYKNNAMSIIEDESSKPKADGSMVTSAPSSRRWRLWSSSLTRDKTHEKSSNNLPTEDVFLDIESSLQDSPSDLIPASTGRIESPGKKFARTNIPTNEHIASLNLKDGQNMTTFSFSTRVLGTQHVDAHLYLWKWNAKSVISDVDGTITKSDVLGQFMPLVGRDWTQIGVAHLFSAIKAYLTRNFLLNLKQDGKALPTGPVVISSDGLFPSLYREACLEDIGKLFPSDYNLFYAGFGNKDTYDLCYREIGIPSGKRFIINPKGEVVTSHYMNKRLYTSLHTLVHDMFPPTSLFEQEDYNSWNFWKVPLPDID